MKIFDLLKTIGVMFCTLLVTVLFAQEGVKIGDNPTIQDPSAILELENANLGLLITRVSLANHWDVTTIPSPANSLLVYNTNFGGGDDPVSPGFYYWREDQGRWVRLVSSISSFNGDVWIDGNRNLLSANSANQVLLGAQNVILGYRAFADDAGVTGNMIAIGEGAAQHDVTTGDARNIAIGYQSAFNNGGYDVTFMGRESGMNNVGNNVVGIGDYAGYNNFGSSVNSLGLRAAFSNTGDNINAFGAYAAHGNTQREVNAIGLYAAFDNGGALVNAIGSYAARQNTGENVNAIGLDAAWANAAPDVNAMGFQAAYSNINWGVNAFGRRAAAGNSAEKINVFGEAAGEYNQGVSLNAMGYGAARNNTGWNVNALGEEAAFNNSGNDLNAFGLYSAHGNTGYSVNAMGFYAAFSNSGANTNAFGPSAAQYNQGYWVNAIGQSACAHNTGYYVNGIGYEAAVYNSGSHAIAIGQGALAGDEFVAEGEGNIGIGYQAGNDIGTGVHNICIGHDTHVTDPTASDQINIGNSIIRDGDGVIQLYDVLQLPATSAPASPVAGMIYFDGSMLHCYDGEFWQALW